MPPLLVDMILSLPYLLGLVAAVHAQATPQVKIGKTTFVGRDITELKLDFFGGMVINTGFIIYHNIQGCLLQEFLSLSLHSVICACDRPFSKQRLM